MSAKMARMVYSDVGLSATITGSSLFDEARTSPDVPEAPGLRYRLLGALRMSVLATRFYREETPPFVLGTVLRAALLPAPRSTATSGAHA